MRPRPTTASGSWLLHPTDLAAEGPMHDVLRVDTVRHGRGWRVIGRHPTDVGARVRDADDVRRFVRALWPEATRGAVAVVRRRAPARFVVTVRDKPRFELVPLATRG